MPNVRIRMKQIRDILKYKDSMSQRELSNFTGASRPTVRNYLKIFKKTDIDHQKACELTDSELLEVIRNQNSEPVNDRKTRLEAKFPDFFLRLKEKGMTLQILWEDYKKEDSEPFGYSRFCDLFNQYRSQDPVTMHLEYKAGDKAFFDFAGEKLHIYNRHTGEATPVEFFVGILPASQLTYAVAVEDQKIPSVIRATEKAYRYFEGVPNATIFDCLKSVVTKGSKYEADTNGRFDHFLDHYDSVNLPARPHRPKDKALVEGMVKILYTRIYTEIRKQKFFEIEDMNREIHKLLEKHNETPLTRINISRRSIYESTEKKSMRPLPGAKYENPSFASAKVPPNYHIYFRDDKHYYSVPFKMKGKQARIIASEGVIEIYVDNQRVAAHVRKKEYGYSTNKEHMHPQHLYIKEMSPEYLLERAEEMPLSIRSFIEKILENGRHPEQACKAASGILHLVKKYSQEKVTKACERAFHFQSISYRAVLGILQKGLENFEDDLIDSSCEAIPAHDNIRGAEYYMEECDVH